MPLINAMCFAKQAKRDGLYSEMAAFEKTQSPGFLFPATKCVSLGSELAKKTFRERLYDWANGMKNEKALYSSHAIIPY